MSESSGPIKKPILSDRSYGTLKSSATIILPAIGALYFALAQIWHLPKAEEVVGSVAAVNVFVGVLVGISTRSYNKSGTKYAGEIDVEESVDGSKMFSLNLNEDPESLETMDEVTFKVNSSNDA